MVYRLSFRGLSILVCAALLALASAACVVAADTAPPAKTEVLIVTGVDLHNWRATTPVLAEGLRQDARFDVRVVEDSHFLDSSALDRYKVVVLHFMNYQVPAPGEAARANLRRYVEAGGGLVLVHFACGAWQDWPEFREVAGRVWDPKLRAHDPRGPFRVEIVRTDHPITQGLTAFDTDDELYTCLAGDRPVELLATAKSKVDGKDYPMAFVFELGRGRVFHCVLGHDAKAIGNPPVLELFRRGTAWAANQSPTP